MLIKKDQWGIYLFLLFVQFVSQLLVVVGALKQLYIQNNTQLHMCACSCVRGQVLGVYL